MRQNNDSFNKLFRKWKSEFKSKLNSDKYQNIEIYILNKDFLKFPEKRGNLNNKIII